MSEWEEVKLGEIAKINPTEKLSKGQIATKIGMEHLQPFTKKPSGQSQEAFNGGMKFKNGDTLIARITPCLENGKTAYIDILKDDEVGFGSTEYIVLREIPKISDKQFLYYFSRSNVFRDVAIASMTGSSGRQRVQTDVVVNHLFNVPPLPEQQAIASVLSSLDDKIDLLHRQNKTLESMAETLFRQWFIEEAKDDWEIKKLADIANIFIGRTPPRKESHWFSTSANDVKWISIKDMASDGCFVNKTSEFLNSNTISNFTIPIIPKDTVVLSFKMTVGRVKITNEDMVSNEAIAQFQIKDTKFSKEWLYCYLKQFNYDVLGTTSSIVTSINTALIKGIEIPAPDDKLIKKFNENSFSIFEKIRFNQIQIQILDNLRDTLLPKFMSGEIRVQH